MNSKICELLDIEFPLVAFTHCRDVVVAVSKAGGCGVLGAVGMTPAQLEEELKWIDDHIDGLPYGVDVLILGHLFRGHIHIIRSASTCKRDTILGIP